MPDLLGKTSRDEALELMQQAIADMQQAYGLASRKRPTKKAKLQAFRLLSGVEASCATLKIALDPWV